MAPVHLYRSPVEQAHRALRRSACPDESGDHQADITAPGYVETLRKENQRLRLENQHLRAAAKSTESGG